MNNENKYSTEVLYRVAANSLCPLGLHCACSTTNFTGHYVSSQSASRGQQCIAGFCEAVRQCMQWDQTPPAYE